MTNGMQEGAAMRAAEQPTPERFFNALNAHQQTEAMKAAVELDVFTAIAEGNTSPAAIAARCAAAERGVRIICDFLTIHGFLTKENVKYGLAPDAAAFLNRIRRRTSLARPNLCLRRGSDGHTNCWQRP